MITVNQERHAPETPTSRHRLWAADDDTEKPSQCLRTNALVAHETFFAQQLTCIWGQID